MIHQEKVETNFAGQKWRPIVKYSNSAVSYAKMAKPIKMTFRKLSGMGPGNHVLDGV